MNGSTVYIINLYQTFNIAQQKNFTENTVMLVPTKAQFTIFKCDSHKYVCMYVQWFKDLGTMVWNLELTSILPLLSFGIPNSSKPMLLVKGLRPMQTNKTSHSN